jgi:TonB family protein
MHVIRKMFAMRIAQQLFLSALLLAIPLCDATARRYSDAEWKAIFIRTPRPDYPYNLRRLRITGSGVFRLYVDKQGTVTSVRILKSTRHQELDAEALKAFMHWRAKPGPLREVDMPITFTMKYPRKGET